LFTGLLVLVLAVFSGLATAARVHEEDADRRFVRGYKKAAEK
jgi:hypothetical protein